MITAVPFEASAAVNRQISAPEVTREELQDEAITMQEYPRTEEGVIEEIE
jgi:hypothetical protein